jgi:hypothetical protein
MLVKLWGGMSFKIYCRSWTYDEVETKMKEAEFSQIRISTLPQIAGVLPADYPANPDSVLAQELFKIENSLCDNTSFRHGAYLIASGSKASLEG